MKTELKKQISGLSLAEADSVVKLAKARINKIAEDQIDNERVKALIDKAHAFEIANIRKDFNSDIIISLFGKEHTFTLSLSISRFYFDLSHDSFEMDFSVKSKRRTFLDNELKQSIIVSLEDAVDCDNFYSVIRKSLPELAEMMKEFEAIKEEINKLTDVERDIVTDTVG